MLRTLSLSLYPFLFLTHASTAKSVDYVAVKLRRAYT